MLMIAPPVAESNGSVGYIQDGSTDQGVGKALQITNQNDPSHLFRKDPTDGSAFRPHRVNPKNGMYRGRQVLNVEV